MGLKDLVQLTLGKWSNKIIIMAILDQKWFFALLTVNFLQGILWFACILEWKRHVHFTKVTFYMEHPVIMTNVSTNFHLNLHYYYQYEVCTNIPKTDPVLLHLRKITNDTNVRDRNINIESPTCSFYWTAALSLPYSKFYSPK